MNMQRLPSDIVGLSKVMPPLSRRYRKGAAEDGWNQLIRWFKKYGVLS